MEHALKPNKTGALNRIINSTEVGLIVLVVAIIALMVFPMPIFLLDALIALNISLSVALLMLAVYVPGPLSLSTFPSLLLFTTIFRLSLNIASAKLILMNGNAGHVIETFGRLVVGGNVIVGLVVFVIIAIVQFIVVAKGSERVAEVGARFTLDGMPGKQMSIDADLRAGLIHKDDAKKRRSELEQESQFHGAMDGAMKYVKGDAICGLLIGFVNIAAGIAVGVLTKDMSLADSSQRYTILTVGDGMVTQIPSLFVSIAAGILITRVNGKEEANVNLGKQIGKQFLSQPVALAFTGLILFLFLLVPGFPKIQFAGLGVIALGLAWVIRRQVGRPDRVEQTPMSSFLREGKTRIPHLIEDRDETYASPLSIGVGVSVHDVIKADLLNDELQDVRRRVRSSLGLPFPGIHVFPEPRLDPFKYLIFLHEVPLSGGELQRNMVRIPYETDETVLQGIKTKRVNGHTLPAEKWVTEADGAVLRTKDILTVGNERSLAMRVEGMIVGHADAFIGIEETQQLISQAGEHFPELSQELIRALPLQRVAEVLRRLVAEGISIRHLREIFESLISWGPREKDVVMLVEYVRIDLGRFTAFRFGYGKKELNAVVLDPRVEQLVRQSVQQTAGGSYVALSQEQSAQIVKSIADGCDEAASLGHSPMVAASMDVRRYIKKMIEGTLPGIPVLSFQEIGNHAVVKPAAMVQL